MFAHNHGRRCGERGHGRRSWGPFSVEWDIGAYDRHRGGRGRRMFDSGELRLVLLRLIADTPRHGYELIKAIEEMTGGAYAPSPGTIYPTLTMLQELGQIAEQPSDDSRKRFEITPDGAMHLEENRELAEMLIARLESIGQRRSRGDTAPVKRAIGNLKAVLGEKLSRGDLTEDQLHEIAALIDATAQRIERLK